MNNPSNASSGLRHVIGVATIAVLSIPGVLTTLSPIALAFVPGQAHAALVQPAVAGAGHVAAARAD